MKEVITAQLASDIQWVYYMEYRNLGFDFRMACRLSVDEIMERFILV